MFIWWVWKVTGCLIDKYIVGNVPYKFMASTSGNFNALCDGTGTLII